jgi:hypothetical protein
MQWTQHGLAGRLRKAAAAAAEFGGVRRRRKRRRKQLYMYLRRLIGRTGMFWFLERRNSWDVSDVEVWFEFSIAAI